MPAASNSVRSSTIPRRVERVGLEVPAQADRVPAAVDLLGVAGEQVLHVALEPVAPAELAEAQRRLREAAPERELHVPAQVGRVRRGCEVGPGGDAVEERLGHHVARLLPDGHAKHRHPRQPARARPEVPVEVPADGARDEVPPGARVGVDRALDGAEHARDELPLVEQHGLRHAAHRGVRVGAERDGLGLAVEADDRRGAPRGRGGLARRPRARDEDRGQLREQRVDLPVDESGAVGVHDGRLPLSRIIRCRSHTPCDTALPHAVPPRGDVKVWRCKMPSRRDESGGRIHA